MWNTRSWLVVAIGKACGTSRYPIKLTDCASITYRRCGGISHAYTHASRPCLTSITANRRYPCLIKKHRNGHSDATWYTSTGLYYIVVKWHILTLNAITGRMHRAHNNTSAQRSALFRRSILTLALLYEGNWCYDPGKSRCGRNLFLGLGFKLGWQPNCERA
jgi:hypothetical protein